MNLKTFFKEKVNFKFDEVPEISTHTVAEFFNSTSRKVIPASECIIAMHKMLCEYAKDALGDDNPARFLSRLHESVAVGNGIVETRRGFCTIMDDGLSYVFASNYFARVVYILTKFGWRPDLNDFKDMISNRRVSVGYIRTTNEERNISYYPANKDAEYKLGLGFRTPNWYLAHIVGVMDPFVGHEGIDLRGCVLPRGGVDDWNCMMDDGSRVRKIHSCLSKEEKEVVVAQFLRFLDPINYVLVPNQKHEVHSPQKRTRIGEEPCLISYLKRWMHKYVNEKEPGLYEDFCRLALAPVESFEGIDADLERLGAIKLKVNTVTQSANETVIVPRIKEEKITKRKEMDTVVRVNDGELKAVRRMKLWSQRPDGHPYKVIRAFLLAQKNGVASRQLIEDYCTNMIDHPDMYIECFTERGSLASLMTDAGNSYGHVFEMRPRHDKIKVWAPIMEAMEKYRDAFLR